MDDDFELLPKNTINELKEENKALRERLERAEQNAIDTKLIISLREMLEGEFKKERDSLIAHIQETKEISKSTLNNLVTKTESLDHRLEELVDGLSDLLKTLSDVVNEVNSFKHSVDVEKLDSLGKKIDLMNYHNEVDANAEIKKKLKDIEEFMEKLKELLGRLKPETLAK